MSDHIAVLIDGENISHRHYPTIQSHLQKLTGTIDCRVYGDWSRSQLHGWKNVVTEEGFTPVHQFNTRKNTTDFELVMDAIRLLYTRRDISTFCIVSSDSDFSSLCRRLKQEGEQVIVMGESKAPPAYRKSCSSFILLETMTSGTEITASNKKANVRRPRPLNLKRKLQASSSSPTAVSAS